MTGGGFNDLLSLDKVSALLRLFPPMHAGPKRVEELGGIRTIRSANLFGVIHADGKMDNFHLRTVYFHYSLSNRQIGSKNSCYSRFR